MNLKDLKKQNMVVSSLRNSKNNSRCLDSSLNTFRTQFCVQVNADLHTPVINWSKIWFALTLTAKQIGLFNAHLGFLNAFSLADSPKDAKVHLKLPQCHKTEEV